MFVCMNYKSTIEMGLCSVYSKGPYLDPNYGRLKIFIRQLYYTLFKNYQTISFLPVSMMMSNCRHKGYTTILHGFLTTRIFFLNFQFKESFKQLSQGTQNLRDRRLLKIFRCSWTIRSALYGTIHYFQMLSHNMPSRNMHRICYVLSVA